MMMKTIYSFLIVLLCQTVFGEQQLRGVAEAKQEPPAPRRLSTAEENYDAMLNAVYQVNGFMFKPGECIQEHPEFWSVIEYALLEILMARPIDLSEAPSAAPSTGTRRLEQTTTTSNSGTRGLEQGVRRTDSVCYEDCLRDFDGNTVMCSIICCPYGCRRRDLKELTNRRLRKTQERMDAAGDDPNLRRLSIFEDEETVEVLMSYLMLQTQVPMDLVHCILSTEAWVDLSEI